MGNLQSENIHDDFLNDYEQLKKEHGGLIIADKQTESNYFLKEYSYADKLEFERQLTRFKHLQNQQPHENLLNIVKVCSKEFNNFCSSTFKIYVVYEYPIVTLQEEIVARKKQNKYFEECQLWAIFQSCINALGEVRPVISLHPSLVFIIPDGLLKVIHNDMITEDHRSLVHENVYYAPEKIKNFHRADHESMLKKQSIFSLGMTLLNAAILDPVNDCYDYQKYEFIEQTLEHHIQKLVGRYSEQLIQILAMILQPNPNKRSSLLEIKGLLTQVWNTEEEEDIENSSVRQSSRLISKQSLKNEEEVLTSMQNGSSFLRETYVNSQKISYYNSQKTTKPLIFEKYQQKPEQCQYPLDKQNIFTDPKLLEMIRRDLQLINKQRNCQKISQ